MTINESIERILGRTDIVADLFYTVFLDRYPELREFFAGVDLKRQAVLLTIALCTVEDYYTRRYKAAELYLKYLGTKHYDLNIPRETYAMFHDAMLATLEQFHGDEWDNALAEQWSDALRQATDLMFEGYERRYHV